jgi:hypothetical protein
VFPGKANGQVKARRTRGVLVLRYHISDILSSAFQLSAGIPRSLLFIVFILILLLRSCRPPDDENQ